MQKWVWHGLITDSCNIKETTHITKSNNREMQFQDAHLLISKNKVQGYSRYWLVDSTPK